MCVCVHQLKNQTTSDADIRYVISTLSMSISTVKRSKFTVTVPYPATDAWIIGLYTLRICSSCDYELRLDFELAQPPSGQPQDQCTVT